MSILQKQILELLTKIHLGRLFCNLCGEYDHNCGCSPSVVERTRDKIIQEAKEILSGEN